MVGTSLENLEDMLDEYKKISETFAKDRTVRNVLASGRADGYDRNVLYLKMSALLAGKVTDSYNYLINVNGDYIIDSGTKSRIYDPKNQTGWGIFRKLNETQEAVAYPNRYVLDGKSISLSVAKRIMEEGKTVGYLIMDIPTSTIEKTLSVKGNLFDMNYMILDQNFYIMYDDLLKDDSTAFFQLDFRMNLLGRQEDIRIVDLNNRKSLLCTVNSQENNIILMAEVPVETILQNNKYITVMTSLMLLFSIVLCCILTVISTNRVSEPIKKIVRAMEKVEKGDIHARVEICRGDDEIAYMARRFNEMVESLDDLFQKNMEKQDRLRLAEIKSLQAQINPHFLYNTLDSIKWLAKLNGVDEVSVIVSKLGNLLKNSIHSEGDLDTVEESMYLIDSYLSIQKIRFKSKFDIVVDIDETIMQCLVPKLVIQPIVENAIVHGIENKIGKSTVKITGKKENDRIVFEVEDDGAGISRENLEKLRNSVALTRITENVALANIHNRIKLYYGEKYGIEIYSEEGKGTRVRVAMPVDDGCSPGRVSNAAGSDSGR